MMADYWIGDKIRIIDTGKTGVYEGDVNGKAKIKAGKKILLVDYDNIEILPDNEDDNLPLYDDDNIEDIHSGNYFGTFNNTLDLHIEKLNPAMQNERAEMIILYQIKRARQFLDEALRRRQLKVVLIHGKGEGVLKSEIENLVNDYDEIFFTKSINNGGALEIMFSYFY